MLTLRAIWNNITYLTRALSNDLENIEKWSRPTRYLLREKGFNISLVRKQQPYNYALTPEISNKFVSQVSFQAHIDELCKNCPNDLDF